MLTPGCASDVSVDRLGYFAMKRDKHPRLVGDVATGLGRPPSDDAQD